MYFSNCFIASVEPESCGRHHSQSSAENVKAFQYGNQAEYEARITGNTPDNPMVPHNYKEDGEKRVRPRYAATELGIRDKLFIGIESTVDSVETNGFAVNKTIGHLLQKLVFFIKGRDSKLPEGLPAVMFTNEHRYQASYKILEFMNQHYAESYDWYYFATDTTYIRAERLMEFVNHMSVIYEVYRGSPVGSVCSLEGGVLLSNVGRILTAYSFEQI